MIVYVEQTFIQNFALCFVLLFMCYKCLCLQNNYKRICFASLFAGVVCVLFPLIKVPALILFLFKLAIGYVIVCIAQNTKIKQTLLFYCCFLIVTFVYGGFNSMVFFTFFDENKNQFMPFAVVLICFIICSYLFWQLMLVIYKKQQINNFKFDVVIENNNKKIHTSAYFDSGNVLMHPQTRKPICLVNFNLFQKINKNFKVCELLTLSTKNVSGGEYITVKTATSTTNMLTFTIDKLIIKNKGKNICVENATLALSKVKISGFDCDLILNCKSLEG